MPHNKVATGYLHPSYARSLSEFGTPELLPKCGGWILTRRIPGFAYRDAFGCYPLFTCEDWSQLESDLNDLEGQLVSMALVADPFGRFDPVSLRQSFRHFVVAFKEHFVADLSHSMHDIVSSHHRNNARKALRRLRVEQCHNAHRFVDDWINLYEAFVSRRRISGLAAFSRRALACQLTVPGLCMFRAVHDDETVGMHLWYVQGDIAFAHLAAYRDLGYRLGASYALFWHALEYFSRHDLRWLELGGTQGALAGNGDGLAFFKKGWSSGTRPAYFCGRILNRNAYDEIVKATGSPATGYFPAYRNGEFD